MGIKEEFFNFKIGELKKGDRNLISDVEGVKVGHFTIHDGDIHTGVTAVLPHYGNIFKEKVMASSYVINGFGKSVGLIQVEELGNIETPIILTNTLSVGTALSGVVKYMLMKNDDIGIKTGTINSVVCECNDGYLNDIRGMHITEDHVFLAIEDAKEDFEEGAVGAGAGMTCFGFKGGIGSASRIIELDDKTYTIGAIVLSNFGSQNDFRLNGTKIIKDMISPVKEDKGSIIIIIATDIPLSERQLKRVCKRASVGLSRLGSFLGNGSGDIVIAFSSKNKINHYGERDILNINILNENKMDILFRAAAEVTEESVLSSMIHSESITGRCDHKIKSLKDFLLKKSS